MRLPHIKVLLINGSKTDYWEEVVRRALKPVAEVEATTEREGLELLGTHEFDLVILDATTIDEASLTIERILARQREARIIVATTTPTWRRARAAFRAGAIDYVSKTLDGHGVRSTICAALRESRLHSPADRWGGEDDEENGTTC